MVGEEKGPRRPRAGAWGGRLSCCLLVFAQSGPTGPGGRGEKVTLPELLQEVTTGSENVFSPKSTSLGLNQVRRCRCPRP